MNRILCCGTLALFTTALPLRAQELRGAVLLENSTTVVAGVIVEARVVGGDSVVARAVTNVRGEFLLRLPGAGSYRIRGLRIGNQPTAFGDATVAANESQLVRYFLTPRPLTLSEVRVVGNRSCGRRALEVSAVSTMLDEARKALQLSQLGGAATTTAEWVVEQQIADLRGRSTGPGSSEIHRGETRQPFVSLPADSLARVGYALSDSSGTNFYAPDAVALLDDSFLLGHCFRTVPPRGVDPAWVGLAFEPVPVRRDPRVGIEGTLWLDRASAELRRLDFSYANLPRHVATREAGGQVSFKRVSDDLWIVDRWTIRMPSPVGADGSMRAAAVGRGGPVFFVTQSLQLVIGRVQSVSRGEELLFGAPATSAAPTATPEVVAAFCGQRPTAGVGVLWGILRDSTGAAVPRAYVEVEWDVGHRWVGESQREFESRGRTAETSPLGVWVACEIPTGVPLTAWGQTRGVSGTTTLLAIPEGSLGLQVDIVIGEPPLGTATQTVRGVVFDSLRFEGPVPFADIRVLGSTKRTFADSLGRFEFTGLPEGPVTLVWRELELDVLGVTPPALTVVAGESDRVVLAGLSLATFAAQRCGGTLSAAGGVLIGEVVDLRGVTRADVEVRAQWGRVVLGGGENSAEILSVVDTTDSGGRFALCGVPRAAGVDASATGQVLIGGEIEVRAQGAGLHAGPVLVELAGAGALRRDLVAGESRVVRVTGRVLDAAGSPVANAIVTVADDVERTPVRTDSTGAFVLEGVPLQSIALAVRAIGFLPTRATLDPKGSTIPPRDIRLGPIPQALDAAVIVGQLMDRRRLGFEERRALGRGSFVDEDVLKNMPVSLQALRAHLRRAEVGGRFPEERLMLRSFSINGSSSCNPKWWVDGIEYGILPGAEQKMLLARAKMIEVYEAWDAPAGYIDFNGCGAVLIWTDVRR